MPALITNLWFDTQAEEAAEFYCSIFPNSAVTGVHRTPADSAHTTAGTVLLVEWELDGHRFAGINGGPHAQYTDAVSLEIVCADQAEVDHYWAALTSDGGAPQQCGWLTDRYGLRWQVVPQALKQYWTTAEPEVSARVFSAMMEMVKIDVAALEAAARG